MFGLRLRLQSSITNLLRLCLNLRKRALTRLSEVQDQLFIRSLDLQAHSLVIA